MKKVVGFFQDQKAGDLRENVFDISCERVARSTYIVRGEVDDPDLKNMLLDSLKAEGLHVHDSVRVLPYGVPSTRALIDLSVATMRSSPSHLAPIVSQALMGMPVRVLKQKGGWAFIQTPDHYLGWCDVSALCFISDGEWEEWKQSPRVFVTRRFSEIRDSETGKILGDLVAGCLLEKTGMDKIQIKVKTPGGIEGLVNVNDIKSFDRNHFPEMLDCHDLAATALELIRTPYLWGGTSMGALDCSGFTKTVFRQHGIVLARDASLQAEYGKDLPVDKGWEVFKTGDLLFFSPDEKSDRITHVGIYLESSEFIHEAGKVKINSLDSTRVNYSRFREKTLVKARRIEGQLTDKGIVYLPEHPWYVCN
ncbi:C40 family peptidase [Marinilabilia salmonicolor]|uniref:C40 family peptidase n=1 Tax=Marinilabilia salmonicolor TaxID=989 RepID=UPI001F44BC6D|nr:C40 family peptidase [Marinilabilia salmonicolor]